MGRKKEQPAPPAPDALDTLAVGVAADFQAEKANEADRAEGSTEVEAEVQTDAPAAIAAVDDAAPFVEGGKPAEAEDHITAHDRAMARLMAIAEEAEFDGGTLVGDLRDTLLDIIKSRPKPWSQTSNAEQRDLANALEAIAKLLVRRVTLVVAEQDEISVQAKLKGYAVDGETFKLKVVAQGDEETALGLFRMDGHDVLLISADSTRFNGQRRDVRTDPDQREIPFADPPAAEQPSHPADNSDLADGADDKPEVEGEDDKGKSDADFEELFHVRADEDGEKLYLDPPAEAWVEKQKDAGSWPRWRAEELAAEHDAELVAAE